LAISGEGFFAVRKGNEVFYTRNGEFVVNGNRQLVNTQGYYLLDRNGNVITLPENGYIDEAGNVYDANRNIVSRVAIYTLQNPRKMGEPSSLVKHK